MRRLTLVFLLFTVSCDAETIPPDPIDMTFRVEVAQVENTCGTASVPADAFALVDARLRSDGTIDIAYFNNWMPGQGFDAARVEQGQVAATQDWSPDGVTTTALRIDGALSMEGIDVILEARGPKPDGQGECLRSVHVSGRPRGFLDREDLDGKYSIHTSYFGAYCDGQTWPIVPLGETTFLLDAMPRADQMYLSLDAVAYAETGLPDAADDLRWTGTVYVNGDVGLLQVPGSVSGLFRPDGVDVLLEFQTPDQTPDCRHVYQLQGYKRTASRARIENAYRGIVHSYDRCGGTDRVFEDEVTLIDHGARGMEVRDPYDAVIIPIDAEGTLADTAGSEAEGVIATFNGKATPPYLSYTLEYQVLGASGWCTIGHQVDAVARFFPELVWEPEIAPAAARLLVPKAQICRVAPVLGPLRSSATIGLLDP